MGKHKRKNETNSTQVYEDQNGKIMIQSKVIRFTDNGV